MFYQIKVMDHIRVPPKDFSLGRDKAILKGIQESHLGHISKNLGFVLNVVKLEEIGEGIIIPNDGAAYYQVVFDLLSYKPELNEVVYGVVRDILDFGAFLSIGPVEGLVHISQSMDDQVSFAKDKVLQGKKTGKTLKVGDKCKARIIAVSFKEITNPKIGLTMRQEGLGRLDWLEKPTAKKETEEKTKKK